MPEEIERKFLVISEDWKAGEAQVYRQGYLSRAKECTVRVRTAGGQGFLTIKGESRGARRAEYEYRIPPADAQQMLETLCAHPLIEKRRYRVEFEGFTWEVDEFLGANQGLVVAEIELAREDQIFPRPPWVGAEVTGNPRYYNSNLVAQPYSAWRDR